MIAITCDNIPGCKCGATGCPAVCERAYNHENPSVYYLPPQNTVLAPLPLKPSRYDFRQHERHRHGKRR